MTMTLSRFFVNSLNNGGEMLTLEREVEHAMSYVYIQKIRYGDKFELKINLPDELKDYMICKLTLQPLIENSINHAFEGIDYPGLIEINFEKAATDNGDDIVIARILFKLGIHAKTQRGFCIHVRKHGRKPQIYSHIRCA